MQRELSRSDWGIVEKMFFATQQSLRLTFVRHLPLHKGGFLAEFSAAVRAGAVGSSFEHDSAAGNAPLIEAVQATS